MKFLINTVIFSFGNRDTYTETETDGLKSMMQP